jgi:predicted DNA-binding mobile mystery protein A
MSTTELATRMGISQSRIPELERGEVAGSLKLGTLERAAEALDCDLVYVLIPRMTLEESVRAQAQRQATARLASIRHTMRLEDQEVGQDDAEDLVKDLASELVDRRGLWTTAST